MDDLLYELVRECTTLVRGATGTWMTGFFVAPNRILTGATFAEGDLPLVVIWRNQQYSTRVLAKGGNAAGTLPAASMLEVMIPTEHPCAVLHESVRPGDVLYSFGFTERYTGGDCLRAQCEGVSGQPRSIKFTGTLVQPGFVGAPMLNERTGAVCGLLYSTRDVQYPVGGRAVPVDALYEFFSELREFSRQYPGAFSRWLYSMRQPSANEEFIRLGDLVIPRGYNKLVESVELFLADETKECKDYYRNVFLMTRFLPGQKTLEGIDATIRETLATRGLVGHRADDRIYPTDRNLWDNVCTYMLGCRYGVAVLEDILEQEFNPNVALEYGFMRALAKPTLLLKESRLKPRADILGTLWEEFDILDAQSTIRSALLRWIDDSGISLPSL
jgi:hypothetical protein